MHTSSQIMLAAMHQALQAPKPNSAEEHIGDVLALGVKAGGIEVTVGSVLAALLLLIVFL